MRLHLFVADTSPLQFIEKSVEHIIIFYLYRWRSAAPGHYFLDYTIDGYPGVGCSAYVGQHQKVKPL